MGVISAPLPKISQSYHMASPISRLAELLDSKNPNDKFEIMDYDSYKQLFLIHREPGVQFDKAGNKVVNENYLLYQGIA